MHISGRAINLLILVYLVTQLAPFLLVYVGSKAGNYTTTSTEKFVMRPVKELAYIGILGSMFAGAMIILAAYSGQLTPFVGWGFGIFFFMGVLVILAPCPHFWDVYVDGDIITSYRCFIKWKETTFSNISYVTINRGGYHLYDENKHKILSIDSYSTNLYNFDERLGKENIEIKS